MFIWVVVKIMIPFGVPLNIGCRIIIGIQKGSIILTLRDPPRPGPAHPREHGDSAAPKSLTPSNKGWV